MGTGQVKDRIYHLNSHRYIYNITMKNLLLLIALTAVASSLPDADKVQAPGMVNETIYSGYLDTEISSRKIHYVFVQARESPTTAPLTIWFNGGPGCSSLIGMLQEIGPYLVGNDYVQGELLTRNEYSWNKASNLLFLESPAVVGFSTDKDPHYHWTDEETADNAFQAIMDFLKVKAPEFKMRDLYLSGESYAGKYVPDVAVRILRNNEGPIENYINLKGLLIGNGVMNFNDFAIERSEAQYLIEHDFMEHKLVSIYRSACKVDWNSPRCRFFWMELDDYTLFNINPYNVYEVCKDKSAETISLMKAIQKMTKKKLNKLGLNLGDQAEPGIPECPNDNGAVKYWNLNKHAFHVFDVNKDWEPCSEINYTLGNDGSMAQYRNIFLNRAVKVWLYNGDWDDVVPYRDTEKNLKELKVQKVGEWESWFSGEDHAGFYQEYEKLLVITVKAASHMVPQVQPVPSYQMFYNFIKNRPINTPV